LVEDPLGLSEVLALFRGQKFFTSLARMGLTMSFAKLKLALLTTPIVGVFRVDGFYERVARGTFREGGVGLERR
jgi:hypothetical protein